MECHNDVQNLSQFILFTSVRQLLFLKTLNLILNLNLHPANYTHSHSHRRTVCKPNLDTLPRCLGSKRPMVIVHLWIASYLWCFRFLGGLSLHLNHLIAERVSAPYWQFGTLPIGIFLSNLDSGQLETSLMTSYCHFWNLSTFGDSRAIWVFWPKLGVFRKSKFSRWRSDGASMWLGGFR